MSVHGSEAFTRLSVRLSSLKHPTYLDMVLDLPCEGRILTILEGLVFFERTNGTYRIKSTLDAQVRTIVYEMASIRLSFDSDRSLSRAITDVVRVYGE